MIRIVGFVGSVGVTAALVGAAAVGTGAYFSDAKSGDINATMGSIKIRGYDGGGSDAVGITLRDMLPGQAQARTIRYQNTGHNNEDVWVVFPQSALGDFDHSTDDHLVNDAGHYAEIHVKGNGVPVFDSANLNDDSVSCPPAGTDCNPLPTMLKVASNLTPGQVGDWSFSFTPGARYGNGVQNLPVLHLPYTLVATQHGITPDAS